MLWPIASYLLGRSHPRLLTIPGRALDWSHPLLTQRTACFDQVRALEMVSNAPVSSSHLSAFTVCTTATTCQINSSTCLRLYCSSAAPSQSLSSVPSALSPPNPKPTCSSHTALTPSCLLYVRLLPPPLLHVRCCLPSTAGILAAFNIRAVHCPDQELARVDSVMTALR